MRIVLVIAFLAATLAPALADQAAADRYIAEQWAKIAVMNANNAKRDASQKALCARVGGVKIGLTAEGVQASCWGKPQRINETVTASHRHAQWVYGGGQYVYLTDGVVTSIQLRR
jgi:Ni/Co efflux regulator RcnB